MKRSKQKFFLVAFTVVMGALFSGLVSAEETKMATVDMQKLFKEYHRTVDTQKRFNTEYARIQKGVNERGEAINRIKGMLKVLADQIKAGELEAEEIESKKREGQMLSQELQLMERGAKHFSTTEKQRVARLKAASMHGIMKEIKEKVAEHAKKQGFDFVFDKSGKNSNQVTFFTYIRDAQDITAHMLKELNKFAPGAGNN
ncbi:MAG: OmpH family outer membrane protein [Akkermansiaceae bacterium]